MIHLDILPQKQIRYSYSNNKLPYYSKATIQVNFQRFQFDSRDKYINNKLNKFFTDKGIINELTLPYSYKSNRVVERFN